MQKYYISYFMHSFLSAMDEIANVAVKQIIVLTCNM